MLLMKVAFADESKSLNHQRISFYLYKERWLQGREPQLLSYLSSSHSRTHHALSSPAPSPARTQAHKTINSEKMWNKTSLLLVLVPLLLLLNIQNLPTAAHVKSNVIYISSSFSFLFWFVC